MIYQFVIDNKFLFTPQKNSIKNIETGQETTLNSPAARCLETLARNRRLVTHDELYISGWGNSEKEPAPNTLYQNILLIRKAFKELSGTSKDYVITVPRKGFIFDEDVHIEVLENVGQASAPPSLAEEVDETLIKEAADEPKSTTISRPAIARNQYLIPGLFFLATLLLLGWLIKNMSSGNERTIFKDGFVYYKELNGCTFYVDKTITLNLLNKSSDTAAVQSLWKKASEDNNFSCSAYPYRYVVLFKQENAVRVLACSRAGDADEEQSCITLYKRSSQ
ncbi:winged helix-turn-helix domain-containing protein [Entomohabitans teleogrylli]|uniref:winged helix-turn-helix domain-containing protein n=1 Tax=Entomohabitans teleogrylli TaxID=1384589 RepID=UPI00073D3D7D|nr:winged helix-turn-helix domain-containing protein [Entomohabitans teleogrylli]